MSLRNRVDPWGDLHETAERGTLTGNRGCLVDGNGDIVRRQRALAWITCELEFKGGKHPINAPGRWTPLFFLDDAVALAAGHRPCAQCRRPDYRSYRDAVAAGLTTPVSAAQISAAQISAAQINVRLRDERRPSTTEGRARRPVWRAVLADVPDGTVVLDTDRRPCLARRGELRRFSFAGWGPPRKHPFPIVDVLTPPTSFAALVHGFRPRLHPSAE